MLLEHFLDHRLGRFAAEVSRFGLADGSGLQRGIELFPLVGRKRFDLLDKLANANRHAMTLAENGAAFKPPYAIT
jgi:hypothetical protein